jgi:hypothetical protein
MSDEKPKVVSLFSRLEVTDSHRDEPVPTLPAAMAGTQKGPRVDQRSVGTLNSVMDAVLKGELTHVMVMGTGPTGLGVFYVSFPLEAHPQREATRYLGQTVMMQDILKGIVAGNYENGSYEGDDKK